jgi:hypothetical protein
VNSSKRLDGRSFDLFIFPNQLLSYEDLHKTIQELGLDEHIIIQRLRPLNEEEKMYLLWFEKQKSLSSKVPSGNNVHTTYENLQNLPNEGKTTKRQFDSTNASVCADAKESPANSIEEAPIDSLDDEVFYPPDDMSDVDIDDFVKDAVVTDAEIPSYYQDEITKNANNKDATNE